MAIINGPEKIKDSYNKLNTAIEARLPKDGSEAMTGDLNMGSHAILGILKQNYKDATNLTINGGAITVTQSYHSVDTEGGAASDFLDTINGGSAGDRLIIRQFNAARDITIRNGVGNIRTFDNSDLPLGDNVSTVELLKINSTVWMVLGAGTWNNVNNPSTLSTNGLQRLASGYVMQYGRVDIPPGVATSVPFPLAFPNNCFGVVGSIEGTILTNLSISGRTNAKFDVQHGHNANRFVMWMAFGN